MNALVEDPALVRTARSTRAFPRAPIAASPYAERKPVHLDRGDTLRVFDGAGLVLRACSGVVWITEERSPRDTVLLPGDTHRVGNAGMTLALAVGPRPARIVVERPAGTPPPRRAEVITASGERVCRVALGARSLFLLRAWTRHFHKSIDTPRSRRRDARSWM